MAGLNCGADFRRVELARVLNERRDETLRHIRSIIRRRSALQPA